MHCKHLSICVLFVLTNLCTTSVLAVDTETTDDAAQMDKRTVYIAALVQPLCNEFVPGHRAKYAQSIEVFRQVNLELFESLENDPAQQQRIDESRSRYLSAQPHELEGLKDDCDTYSAPLLEFGRPVNARMLTPEGTWQLFNESLDQGDFESALNCLTSSARKNFRKSFSGATDQELRSLSESFISFGMLAGGDDTYQRAFVKKDAGWGGEVMFFKNSKGEWQIVSL